MSCDAELCEYWTGQGCICEVMGIERAERCDSFQDGIRCADPAEPGEMFCRRHAYLASYYEPEI